MFKVLAMILGLCAIQTQTVGAEEVDVELLLAVDTSGSMDFEEASVQRSGYVEALRHPDFINAVNAGRLGRIAIGYFEWAGLVNEDSVIPWQVIDNSEDAIAFAAKLQSRPIQTRHATSISTAIMFGTLLIESNEFLGERRILDVSGDGPNNMGPPVTEARARALGRGITINGLAIAIHPSDSYGPLEHYYRDCVIGGPGAFVIAVREAEGFTEAIHHKLVLEVSGRALVLPFRLVADMHATDCLVGEKQRPGFLDRFYLDR